MNGVTDELFTGVESMYPATSEQIDDGQLVDVDHSEFWLPPEDATLIKANERGYVQSINL